jgi:glutathione S-transferase
MHILYARKNTGSAAVEALLEVLGLAYELREVEKDADQNAPTWYLKINPRGEVPALQLPDGQVITESAAMMIYLADLKPEANLAPATTSPTRASYLRWLVYLAANAYTSDLRMYYPERYSTELNHASAIKSQAIRHLARDFDIFANQISPSPFIFGNQVSAADIYASMLFTWADDVAVLFSRQPKLKTVFDATSKISGVAKAWTRNGMT